ncbi:uncharacterized protein MYCFIDRAFT_180054 [Pseudocercospora fijiensis CIRAD86]|uniref:Uncharacterized protein n=1 Tax=Pseudocercospora fijiensis (strain CIRAD86) TaxID=383855 RepID=M3AJ15_PSEFD|nr:uncharacterized protein MYCFIDRAFT_180054 [Pseudocercospora fijiensis CIRAD86]EME77178.1 hypothetical protein MYCFIDRAFT_180054 [Pseudocercospora fijiensis CIRAD86]
MITHDQQSRPPRQDQLSHSTQAGTGCSGDESSDSDHNHEEGGRNPRLTFCLFQPPVHITGYDNGEDDASPPYMGCVCPVPLRCLFASHGMCLSSADSMPSRLAWYVSFQSWFNAFSPRMGYATHSTCLSNASDSVGETPRPANAVPPRMVCVFPPLKRCLTVGEPETPPRMVCVFPVPGRLKRAGIDFQRLLLFDAIHFHRRRCPVAEHVHRTYALLNRKEYSSVSVFAFGILTIISRGLFLLMRLTFVLEDVPVCGMLIEYSSVSVFDLGILTIVLLWPSRCRVMFWYFQIVGVSMRAPKRLPLSVPPKISTIVLLWPCSPLDITFSQKHLDCELGKTLEEFQENEGYRASKEAVNCCRSSLRQIAWAIKQVSWGAIMAARRSSRERADDITSVTFSERWIAADVGASSAASSASLVLAPRLQFPRHQNVSLLPVVLAVHLQPESVRVGFGVGDIPFSRLLVLLGPRCLLDVVVALSSATIILLLALVLELLYFAVLACSTNDARSSIGKALPLRPCSKSCSDVAPSLYPPCALLCHLSPSSPGVSSFFLVSHELNLFVFIGRASSCAGGSQGSSNHLSLSAGSMPPVVGGISFEVPSTGGVEAATATVCRLSGEIISTGMEMCALCRFADLRLKCYTRSGVARSRSKCRVTSSTFNNPIQCLEAAAADWPEALRCQCLGSIGVSAEVGNDKVWKSDEAPAHVHTLHRMSLLHHGDRVSEGRISSPQATHVNDARHASLLCIRSWSSGLEDRLGGWRCINEDRFPIYQQAVMRTVAPTIKDDAVDLAQFRTEVAEKLPHSTPINQYPRKKSESAIWNHCDDEWIKVNGSLVMRYSPHAICLLERNHELEFGPEAEPG